MYDPISSQTGTCVVTGARKHLERGHEKYMRQIVMSNREVAQRGGGLEGVKEVQAFLAAKLQGRGPLDFQQQAGAQGHDTTWIQVCGGAGHVEEGWGSWYNQATRHVRTNTKWR